MDIDSLPSSLEEALKELAQDEVIRWALGEDIYAKFVEAKEKNGIITPSRFTPGKSKST